MLLADVYVCRWQLHHTKWFTEINSSLAAGQVTLINKISVLSQFSSYVDVQKLYVSKNNWVFMDSD